MIDMEIAIWTFVFLFSIVIPAYIFWLIFFSGNIAGSILRLSPISVFIISIPPGLIFHCTFLYLVMIIFPNHIGTKLILEIIQSIDFSAEISPSLTSEAIWYIFHYNLWLWIMTFVISILIKIIIRKLKLDRKVSFLRFRNNWHYVLSGEYLDFRNVSGSTKSLYLVWIDAMVNVAGKMIIYSGGLIDYKLDSKTGELDEFSLYRPVRSCHPDPCPELSKDNNGKVEKFMIPGNKFIIKYVNTVNINISYLTKSQAETYLNNNDVSQPNLIYH